MVHDHTQLGMEHPMASRPGASDSQMVPIEEVEKARAEAEACSAKRDVLWGGIKNYAGACNTLSWKLFGIGVSLCSIVMIGVIYYMGIVGARADDYSQKAELKNEKQDEKIRQIELQVVKEISEMNIKMIDVQALLAAQAAQKGQKTGP